MAFRHRWSALVLGFVAVVNTSAATADEATFEDYQMVMDLFTTGVGTDVYVSGGYLALIAADIRGRWAALHLSEPVSDPAMLDQIVGGICENRPTNVNPVAPSRVVMELTNTRTETSLTYDYQYLIGATFTARVDPFEFVAYFGLGRPGLEQAAVNAMRDAQANAQIYVVSHDVFILARSTQLEFYFRCPGDDGVGNQELAIDDALLRIIDGAFDFLDGDLRAAYLDCGRKALQPATREDLAALYRVIDGGSEIETQFAEDRPEIASGLAVCFAAAREQ